MLKPCITEEKGGRDNGEYNVITYNIMGIVLC